MPAMPPPRFIIINRIARPIDAFAPGAWDLEAAVPAAAPEPEDDPGFVEPLESPSGALTRAKSAASLDPAVKAAALWLHMFSRTLKTCRLYDAGNPTVQRFRDELVKGMGETDVREKLMGLGVEPDGRAPAEFAKFHQADIARWTAIAKAANIKADE